MKIEQYKNDVSSLKLSDSFKQSLKESMAKEYASVAVSEAPARPWMKYSKYIATAACLVLIVATIGVVSLMGDTLRVEKSADVAVENNMAAPEMYDSKGNEEALVEEVTNDVYVEEDVEDDAVVEEEIAADEEDEVAVLDEELEEVIEEVEPAIDEMTEEAPDEAYRSVYAPEDYDGEYYAEDYIVGNATSPDYEAVNVARSFNDLAAFDGEIDDAPVAEEGGSYDSGDDISYSDLSLDTLRHLDSVNFVKFTVENVYSADDAVAITGDTSFESEKTLYEINLTYDYLNSVELDMTMLLAYPGTEENQLLGRPIMEDGEKYLACLTFDNGYAEMLYELSYQVHRINGLDIAYHLIGGEGVDPGYTNMGMLDLEYEVITTTINNPAKYTHKAAVKELSRYIKRNWTRQEYEFTDFDNLEEDLPVDDEVNEETPDEPMAERVEELALEMAQGEVKVSLEGVDFDPKGSVSTELQNRFSNKPYRSVAMQNASRVEFDGTVIIFDSVTVFRGQITEIATSSNKPVNITVNGVGVGSQMAELVNAFGIDDYVDDRLSLSVSTVSENGTAYVVTIEVVDNVITQMTIK